MKHKYTNIFLFLTILFSILSCTNGPTEKKPSNNIITVSEDWGIINYDKAIILNNVWNKGSTTDYNQVIFKKTNNQSFGWEWEWPFGYPVVAYPEIIYGPKPWDGGSGYNTEFPVLAGSKNITVNYNMSLNTTGVNNTAFSIWATSDNPVSIDGITHEIMIWIDNNGMSPAGTYRETITVDGTNFDVYVREDHGDASGGSSHIWTYVAFDPVVSKFSGPLSIHIFINYLISENILTNDKYLTSIELGNEVIHGTGYAEITNYEIIVEDK